MPPYISIGGYADPPRIPCLSLEAAKGELVVVAGPPGSGKSNLIKSLAGIRTFSSGSLKIMGSRPGSARSRRAAAFVFQKWNFIPDLPVRTQLERRTALMRGVPVRTVRRDVALRAGEMELSDCLDLMPGQLNRSELQLFSLAPLVLVKTPAAVLDEPLAHLSSVSVGMAVEMILSVLERGTVLAAAQNRSPLLGRADKVVRLA